MVHINSLNISYIFSVMLGNHTRLMLRKSARINTWDYVHSFQTLFKDTDKPMEDVPLTIPNWNTDSVYELPKVHLVVFLSSSITVSWECWCSKGQKPICCAFTVSSWYTCGTYSTWIIEHQSVCEQEEQFFLSCELNVREFRLYSSHWRVLFFLPPFFCSALWSWKNTGMIHLSISILPDG